MESRKPKIRFKGFTDPWEQRKLGEIASIKTGPFGSLLHAEEYVDDGIPIVTTEHFKSSFLPDEKAGLPQVSESDRARLEQYSAIEGDILFSRVGSVDVNAQVTAAQSGWLFSGRVLRVRPVASVISPDYLHYELSTDDVKRSIINRAVGGTMASTNTEILEETEISFPRSVKEQLEIGGFLGNLDTLITLHQRKLNALKKVKKSLLEKMFPKPGEFVPEIRFEGFTDPWEQRKLGEIASIKTGPFGSLLHAEEYVDDGIPIVTTEHFKSSFLPDEKAGLPQVSESDRARLEQYSAIEGDILFSRVGSVDVNAQVTAAQSGWLFSGRVLRVRPVASVISPDYLHYELSTDDVKRSIINRAVGGTMASTNTEILEETEISFPRSVKEQLEIGGFLGNLDTLITLHQRKLTALKIVKKSLLEKMFV